MKNKRLENSIQSLINLYTVVIGAALSIAVAVIVDANKGLDSITTVSACLFMAFLVTLVPFFHGALRHLDDHYLQSSIEPRATALIVDFGLLLLHALAFLVLSQLLKSPVDFAWVLVGVLAIDIAWGTFAHFMRPSGTRISPEGRWTVINVVFVLLVVIYLVDRGLGFRTPISNDEGVRLAAVMAGACGLRSFVDYFACREIYFPNDQACAPQSPSSVEVL